MWQAAGHHGQGLTVRTGGGGGEEGLGLQDLEARAQGSELGRTLQVFRGSSLRLGLQAELVNWRELRQPAYDAIRASGLRKLKTGQ